MQDLSAEQLNNAYLSRTGAMKQFIWMNERTGELKVTAAKSNNDLASTLFTLFVSHFLGDDRHLNLFDWVLIGEL